MAVATKAPKMSPKARPANLTRVNAVPEGFEVAALTSAHPKDVFTWAEKLQDGLQKDGKTLTPKGFTDYINAKISDKAQAGEVLAALKSIYAKKAGGDGASTPAPKGKAAKAATKPAKGEKRDKAKADPAAEMEPVRFVNKTKIPVTWNVSKVSGRNICNVFDKYPVRAFVRYLGTQGWSNEGVLDLLTKGLGLGKYHKDMKHHVVGAHMAAGRNAKPGDNSVYGDIPVLEKDEAAIVKAYKK